MGFSMGFVPRLESLRGIAALTVVSSHVWGLFSDTNPAGTDAVAFSILHGLSNGTGAVVAFFVLSGFVLARSLEANPEPLRFFRGRVFRLFPAAIATVALLVWLHRQWGLYVAYEGDFSPGNVLLNMLMIRTDINAVMWSLKVECFATPLILFSAWLVRVKKAAWLWAIVAALFGLSFVGAYRDALGDATNLAPLYAFVIGVLAHHCGKQIANLRPVSAVALMVLCIGAFCYCGTRHQSGLLLAVECVAAAGLVMLIVWQPLAIFSPLDWAPVRFYGRISYSLYLLHLLGILFASRLIAFVGLSIAGSTTGYAIVMALAILITTPVAYLSWRFIEVPCVNIGRTTLYRFGGLRLVPNPVKVWRRRKSCGD